MASAGADPSLNLPLLALLLGNHGRCLAGNRLKFDNELHGARIIL